MEHAGGDGHQPGFLTPQQSAGGPAASGILMAVEVLGSVDLIGHIVRVEAALLRSIADEKQTKNAKHDGANGDGNYTVANAQPTYQKCDKGDKGDGGQIVAHGGVAHDDAFFLGEPLGDQIPAGDVARRHDAAHHNTHADGIHGKIDGIAYAEIGQAGDN